MHSYNCLFFNKGRFLSVLTGLAMGLATGLALILSPSAQAEEAMLPKVKNTIYHTMSSMTHELVETKKNLQKAKQDEKQAYENYMREAKGQKITAVGALSLAATLPTGIFMAIDQMKDIIEHISHDPAVQVDAHAGAVLLFAIGVPLTVALVGAKGTDAILNKWYGRPTALTQNPQLQKARQRTADLVQYYDDLKKTIDQIGQATNRIRDDFSQIRYTERDKRGNKSVLKSQSQLVQDLKENKDRWQVGVDKYVFGYKLPHLAVLYNNDKVLAGLIEAGFDMQVRDSYNHTPFDLALRMGDASMAQTWAAAALNSQLENYETVLKKIEQYLISIGEFVDTFIQRTQHSDNDFIISQFNNQKPARLYDERRIQLFQLYVDLMHFNSAAHLIELESQGQGHVYRNADSKGTTALHIALSVGNYAAASFLIHKNLSLYATTQEDKKTKTAYDILHDQVDAHTQFAENYVQNLPLQVQDDAVLQIQSIHQKINYIRKYFSLIPGRCESLLRPIERVK